MDRNLNFPIHSRSKPKGISKSKTRRRTETLPVLAVILVCLLLCYVLTILANVISLIKTQPIDLQEIDLQERQFAEMETSRNKSNNGTIGSQFPPDLFSLEQKRMGAIILHIIGIIYMFIGIALVCDEFFVPSLELLAEKSGMSDDVAGATLMAAGGSAPEFFVSLFGIFFARNSIGFGTVVGSAVFNIMFVIGACGLLSRVKLPLSWWPLFRDTFFYTVALALLIGFFQGGAIEWYESLVLFLFYLLYVLFMLINQRVEKFVHKIEGKLKKLCRCSCRNRVDQEPVPLAQQVSVDSSISEVSRAENVPESKGTPRLSVTKRCCSHDSGIQSRALTPVLHAYGTLTTVPLESVSKLPETEKGNKRRCSAASNTSTQIDSNLDVPLIQIRSVDDDDISERTPEIQNEKETVTKEESQETEEEMEEMENEVIVSLCPPKRWFNRIQWVLFFPLILLLCLTLVDSRQKRCKSCYPVTFVGSIVWIAIFSYFMVWWATAFGETANIPPSVMGYTFLAAGTSIPDLVSSVIVARKGRGDMAVSSSIGSNLFDVTVGLPIPWLLFSAVNNGVSIVVFSSGLFCSVILLAGMLLAAIVTLGLFKWTLTKPLGIVFMILYVIFITLGILLELVLECSIS